jgi:hypothetical protein
LLNWYYQIENYLEIGKPMAEVKGTYIKKLPIAIGTKKQIQNVEDDVVKLLDLCQTKYDKKYSFVHYIKMTYEPKKITNKLENFELLSFKNFTAELNKQKVSLTAKQKMELLGIYEGIISEVESINTKIETTRTSLDLTVFDIYKIPSKMINKII